MADPSLISSVTEMNDKFLGDIKCPYKLYIADSRMSGAGFGIFVREEVPAGKEVFRVAVPTVSAVESAVDVCDNCFAWVGSNDPFRAPIELSVCGSCKAVKYCSKGCQRAAWRRYHKEEYKIYREINAHARKAKEFSSAIRMLVRLVVLHQHRRLTDKQWQAILSLKSHKALIEQSKALD
ncbi:hypothetical protein ABVK25_001682 [Lepraria finkii]|uniref:MYND-type domain-containing protein n=1 Tax=Lepraria finkii TaxID=1340010 RepID=A0ABR4BJT0_9LECA